MYDGITRLEQPTPLSREGEAPFLPLPRHEKAIDLILAGLRRPEGGIVLVCGAAGVGKTRFLDHLLDALDQSHEIARLPAPPQGDQQTLPALLQAFRVPQAPADYQGQFRALIAHAQDRLRQGRPCLFAVDDAEALTPYQQQVIAYLAGLKTQGRGLFRILLAGEETRLARLAQAGELQDHLLETVRLSPLDAKETWRLLLHGLKHHGWRTLPQIEPDALAHIHRDSGGLPGAVLSWCERLARQGERDRIGVEQLRQADRPAPHSGTAPLPGEPEAPPAPEAPPQSGAEAIPDWLDPATRGTEGRRRPALAGRRRLGTLVLLAAAVLVGAGVGLWFSGTLRTGSLPLAAHGPSAPSEEQAHGSHDGHREHAAQTPAGSKHEGLPPYELEAAAGTHTATQGGGYLDLRTLAARRPEPQAPAAPSSPALAPTSAPAPVAEHGHPAPSTEAH